MSIAGDDTASDARRLVPWFTDSTGASDAIHSSAVAAATFGLTLLRARAASDNSRVFQYSRSVRAAFCLAAGGVGLGILGFLIWLITGVSLIGVIGIGAMAVGSVSAAAWLEIAKRERNSRSH